MSTKLRKTKTQKRISLLVSLLFAAATLIGGIACFIRAPEIPTEDDIPDKIPVSGTEDTQQDQTQQDTDPDLPVLTRKEDFFTILVSGVDDGNGNSDTNILVAFDAGTGQINCVSIPRDTLIDVDWGVKKINACYGRGGIELMAEKLEEMLGIPIDFTVTVDLQAFVKLVDTIGGVEFNVPIDMDYDDPYQDLSIHFSKGYQYLNGENALKVVRFRHNNDGSGYGTEDLGRIGTQQAFLKAVAKKMLALENLDKVSSYAQIFFDYVDTDLTVGNIAWFGTEVFSIGLDNINFMTLPGDGQGWYKGGSYYILYPEEVQTMVNTYFNPYTTDLTLDDMHVFAP
ncbi:MAG: LCP family protein [Oscillospiraceae bacterium]|nr:LCP family protein [Oscillospiraceae bacterium]